MAAREYELTYIVGDIAPEAAKKVQQEVEGILSKREAVITSVEEWGHRRLFHPAKKNQYGHFYYVTFKAKPENIQAINADLRVTADVVKFLICRADEG
ncbi:MAG: 30S ribosomal protein S6 [Leptospiraceae bacterium]|nr:30S ribosomal protein S6 [Leptospiraceae bacterium]